MRKLTILIPETLVRRATRATKKGITPTIRAGLELLAANDVYERLLKMKGKVKFAMTWQELRGIESIPALTKLQLDAHVLSLLPEPMILQHKVLPLGYANNRLTLGMVNPNDQIALDDVRRAIKAVIIEPAVISEEDFRQFMTTTYIDLLKKEEEKKAHVEK